MRYSEKFVWEMVGEISPGLKKAKDSGVHMNLPQCLNRCAVDILIDDKSTLEINWSYAKMVIQQALRELNERGWMEFGDKEQMW